MMNSSRCLLLILGTQLWAGSLAWTSVKPVKVILGPSASACFSAKDPFDAEASLPTSSLKSRREWFLGLANAATTLGLLPAEGLAAPTAKATPASCDPTVTVWKRGDRIIYLLGTAHISTVSADLAGQLVRDVIPPSGSTNTKNAVFVELDIKRVGNLGKSIAGRLPTSQKDGQPASRILIPATSGAPAVNLEPAIVSAAATMAAPVVVEQPIGMRDQALDFGAAQVGNAVRGMYKNLDKQGFKPGEEFVMAVQEGRKLGADIVLGDQDVQVTLRRLVQALQVTDLNKLMSPDSKIEKSMRELLPGGESTEMNLGDKDELEYFVEAVKTRDKVRKIMGELKDVAPALVQVMLTERDAYMATGLNSLDGYETTVAVMGIAHQDGVEKNLKAFGWKQVKLRCLRQRIKKA